jgi:prolyl-tRNA synthetase
LETDLIKIQEIDFEALKAGSASKGKDNARIDGAVQVAIGVKKEADFSSWYTNVCYNRPNVNVY